MVILRNIEQEANTMSHYFGILKPFRRFTSYQHSKFPNVCPKQYSSDVKITLGNITKVVKVPKNPQFVPQSYLQENCDQSTLHHLRWMMQKDILGQDIFLLGPPGPKKRNIAMQYLELTSRELEYVALSRDTTESDLKQRREIVSGTAKYFDQSAVRAATEGSVLVLEGIEKAERNVLPVLNNLLENREMHLEDGRLLIPSSRYDKLLQEHGKEELDKWKLVRVSEDFRVIALGLPVPKYAGNPLDPPLRSRFQARDIGVDTYQEYLSLLKDIAPTLPFQKIESLVSAAFALNSKESIGMGLPDFPVENLRFAVKILENNPGVTVYDVISYLYPYNLLPKSSIKSVETLLEQLKIISSNKSTISLTSLSENIKNLFKNDESKTFIETPYQQQIIEKMLQGTKVADLCVIGPKGCGKSILTSKVSNLVNKETEDIVLYHDMTSRDLLQQRTTLENGDTVWRFSPLITAALEGKIAVLDGIHRIHPSTLSVLHRLVHDRELQLYDGKRLISSEKYDKIKENFGLSDEQLLKSGILKIHPGFQIIALGEPPTTQAVTNWLTPEMISLFLFQEVRPLSKQEETEIISKAFGPICNSMKQLIELAHILRSSSDNTLKSLAGHLSTRQLLRIASRLRKFPTNDTYDIIQNTFMSKFLPPLARQALDKTLQKLQISPLEQTNESEIGWNIKDDVLTIGNTSCPIYKTDSITRIPSTLFYDIPQHLALMERILQDFLLGSHLLLVGNQGVGKNKIVDRFLELMNRPREYIQLHRDTTVQTLTTQPTIKDGVLVHEDSPLVQAVKYGHVLIVDEADKAPTHVTCILKTLVESGQMILSDGRKIIKKDTEVTDPNQIRIHPDFRMIVLANRPGFPFLGNDFFGALGDLFSCHSVDNPSKESEIALLKQYGPNVPENVIKTLVGVFGELRTMADQGLVAYPYSTREVVNIVKHLEKFPETDLEDTLFNVLDFDKYSPEVLDTVADVLSKYGFRKSVIFNEEYYAKKRAKERLQMSIERKSGLDTKGPKHGKEDPKNEPHVGGNTWAGGTGGRDTAGLGGKGGPYRLDKGHQVHQLSDEEKAAVPEHIRRAAQEMGRKAFQERLKEIGMSGYDASLYAQLSGAVAKEVQSLRVILSTLQSKNKERQWSRHQTSGELDDVKLIDGLLGEKTVFRRRIDQQPEPGSPQIKPKRLRLVVDVSGSMYRFNGYDGRLERELEAVILLMEAMEGFEDKIEYDIMGHSGEDDDIVFVKKKETPKNNKQRLDVIHTMHAHSQFCLSGDHTLEATQLAVKSLAEEDCDEAIVVILSDANLQRYGIKPADLGAAMTAYPNVNAYAVFIGSLGDQAERLTRSLPAGHAFICNDLSKLPLILKQIFSSSVIQS